ATAAGAAIIARHAAPTLSGRTMLLGLTIRDFVLIERLELAFRTGLCVLTGETGAGKSILLDALGFALGTRAEAGMVRHGATQAAVTAEFAVAPAHPARRLLAEAEIGEAGAGGTPLLPPPLRARRPRRRLVDDAPVSVGLLKQIGDTLVEIQGQFEQRGLLDPATHRGFLDAFGGYDETLAAQSEAWRRWRELAAQREAAAERLTKAAAEEDY